jgi:hypothetical protein
VTMRQRIREYWPLMLAGLFITGVCAYALYLPFSPSGIDMAFHGRAVAVTDEQVTFVDVSPDASMSGLALAAMDKYKDGEAYTFNLGRYNSRVIAGQGYIVILHGGRLRCLMPWPL